MSTFTPKKIDLSLINNGNRFVVGNTPSPSTFNDPIEASAYAQALATNQPNVQNLSSDTTPNVYIEELSDGTPRLVFEGLKGREGARFRIAGNWILGSRYFNNEFYIDCVYYQGSTYACVQTEQSSLLPPPQNANWQLLVSGTSVDMEDYISEEDLTIREFE